MKPESLLFAKTHEWVAVASEGGQKTATVGITAFAVEQLTDVVAVDLPRAGKKVVAGSDKGFGEIESVKAVSDVYAPVTGEVVEVNGSIEGSEDAVNKDPYGKGWLFRIKVSDRVQLGGLQSSDAYQALLAEQA